jgi:hypothetical protein
VDDTRREARRAHRGRLNAPADRAPTDTSPADDAAV